jgi:uncharacterized protein YjbI with pentapeptide repeats
MSSPGKVYKWLQDSAMTVNIELLDRALAHIDAHPEQWDQTAWCGTAQCIAGWVCTLAGVKHDDDTTPDTAAKLLGLDSPLHPIFYRRNNRLALSVWRNILAGEPLPDLRGANLQGADLYGVNLAGADMQGADLTRASLIRANLTQANLTQANLTSADLYGAKLVGANLRDASLENAYLSSADLTGANLQGADLYVANLSSANLTGADMQGADLTDADLTGAIGLTACKEKTQ